MIERNISNASLASASVDVLAKALPPSQSQKISGLSPCGLISIS